MVSRILSRFNREHVISLEMPKWKRASSRLEGRISWFFSSCSRFLSSYKGDLKDPLMWPQESPVSLRVARGFLGFLSIGAGSKVLIWNLGRNLRVPLHC